MKWYKFLTLAAAVVVTESVTDAVLCTFNNIETSSCSGPVSVQNNANKII